MLLDLDLDKNKKGDFNRWGWTNGLLSASGTYEFELWTCAGQCDISKGELIGTVTISYVGSAATVTFNITTSPYYLVEAHVYAGNEQMPRINGYDA